MTNTGVGVGGGSGSDSRNVKKKQRIGSSGHLSSLDSETLPPPEGSHKRLLRRSSLFPIVPTSSTNGGFNDSATADVILRLILDQQQQQQFEQPSDDIHFHIHLHSCALRRSKYFDALLSGRWQHHHHHHHHNVSSSLENTEITPRASSSDHSQHQQHDGGGCSSLEDTGNALPRASYELSVTVPANTDSINNYLAVLQLLYADDLLSRIDSLSTAINLLPVAVELLFEECIKACVKFLEAVPWSEDEERKIINMIPLLNTDEAKELLARVLPMKTDSSEEMLNGLIFSAINNHSNMAFAKAFVAMLLKDFSSRETARKVLDRAFEKSLRVVKQSLEEYSSPVFRGDPIETEAIQRLNLHTAMHNLKHVSWLVDRMIELKVADTAVKAWSEQVSLTADLQRALREDAWKGIVPSLPVVVLRCTCRLANAVATGNILASRQVRMKLVSDWLPVLIKCKDGVSLLDQNQKSLCLEMEETFLRIISTLPVSDAQDLLQQCLSFSTRNVDDCPHLVAAFTTWFRRANRTQQAENISE